MRLLGFPDSSVGKKIHLQCRKPQFDPWVRKIPWRKAWQPTPVLTQGSNWGFLHCRWIFLPTELSGKPSKRI